MRAHAISAPLLLVLMLGATSYAQDDSPADSAPKSAVPPATAPDPDQAEFLRALQLYEDQRFTQAATAWETLLAKLGSEKGWKINYNLGLAYQAAGDATFAVERFEAFVARVANQPDALSPALEQRREDAVSRVRAIKTSHSALVFAKAMGIARIDGGAPRVLGFTAYVAPGKHSVEVTGPTGATRRSDFDLAKGQSVTVDTSDPAPRPSPPPPPPPPPQPAPPVGLRFPTWYVVGGAAATGLGFILPAVLWQGVAQSQVDAEDLGSGHTGYAAKLNEFEDARSAYYGSFALPAVLGGITAAIAVVGIVRSKRGTTVRTGVTPSGLWLAGSF